MEFSIAGVAFLGVLGQGILRGVLLGAVLSILLLLRRGAQPITAELGRVGRTDLFPTLTGGPDRARLPGVFIFRSDGALLYFNVDYVRDRFFELLDARTDRVDTAVYFLGTVPSSTAGADMLIELGTPEARGVELRLAALTRARERSSGPASTRPRHATSVAAPGLSGSGAADERAVACQTVESCRSRSDTRAVGHHRPV
jgi:MFS superfamily sulfate permease-like transporter